MRLQFLFPFCLLGIIVSLQYHATCCFYWSTRVARRATRHLVGPSNDRRQPNAWPLWLRLEEWGRASVGGSALAGGRLRSSTFMGLPPARGHVPPPPPRGTFCCSVAFCAAGCVRRGRVELAAPPKQRLLSLLGGGGGLAPTNRPASGRWFPCPAPSSPAARAPRLTDAACGR